MINFIDGQIVEVTGNSIILMCNGIGYELISTAQTVQNAKVGESTRIYTFMSMHDNQLFMYGFSDYDEREMFLKLITVGGIGSKLAVNILSGITLKDLSVAIISSDASRLSKLKGVGKKTAERIILELKEKVTDVANEVRAGGIDSLENEIAVAQATLIALGINRAEAAILARESAEQGDVAETIVIKALRV